MIGTHAGGAKTARFGAMAPIEFRRHLALSVTDLVNERFEEFQNFDFVMQVEFRQNKKRTLRKV